jgi:hypothetical protein
MVVYKISPPDLYCGFIKILLKNAPVNFPPKHEDVSLIILDANHDNSLLNYDISFRLWQADKLCGAA